MPELTLLGLKTSTRHWISLLWTFMPEAVYLVKTTPREERLKTLLPDSGCKMKRTAGLRFVSA